MVWDGQTPNDGELLAALDRLVAAYHDTPDDDASESDAEGPREEWKCVYDAVAARFPDYGLYALADPLASLGGVAMTGDAVDDLADITLDMREVLWLAEHVSAADAHWSFRLFFFHWGRHARELSLYLHARLDWDE